MRAKNYREIIEAQQRRIVMNIADKQDFTLSVILVILVAIVVFSGVYMWMPHHGSGWIESVSTTH